MPEPHRAWARLVVARLAVGSAAFLVSHARDWTTAAGLLVFGWLAYERGRLG